MLPSICVLIMEFIFTGFVWVNISDNTVLYSCEKLKGLININEEIKNDIENITIKITNI